MKKFKDLKKGDYVYFIFDDNEIKKYSIESTEKRNFLDRIIYFICFKNIPWINIDLNKYELNKSKKIHHYEDPGCCRHFAYVYTTKEELLNELCKRKEKLINEINKQIIFAEKL